jgi:hypothetical protein
MKRISSLLALGFLSLGLATSATAQTKVTQLVIQNTTGTTKLSQTSSGLDITNKLIIHCPAVPANSVTLQVPYSASALNTVLTFPATGGTLLTTEPNEINGDAMIAAINEGTGVIEAARLDLSGLGVGGVQTVAAPALNNTLTFGGTLTDIDISLNLGNANTWTATQTFPVTLNQGNALINSINAGNIALTGYVTSSSLSTTLNGYVTNSYLTSNYTTTLDMHTAITNAINTATGGTTTVKGSGTIDFPATSGSQRSDATITVTGAAVGDAVALATPTDWIFSENTTVSGWVSAANTVTIRFSNNGNGGSINPPSATVKVVVFK